MKVGILTFHRACNYGALLQCYALQETIKSLGHQVEVVDYRSQNIERSYKILNTWSGYKTFLYSIWTFKKRYGIHKYFKKFRREQLCISKEKYLEKEDFSNSHYDCFVIGSDQVWSQRINEGYNDVYWGNFLPKVKKIAYAASMGGHQPFTPEDIQLIKDLLGNFSAVSVREDVLKKDLERIVGEGKIKQVFDPTLIADKKIYENILVKPSISNYVLYYQMGHHPNTKNIISNVAKQLNCSVVIIGGDEEEYGVEYKHFGLKNLSVQEFLGLFKYAKFVFSSSFHGTAFSIIFEKDFYYVANARIERAKSLLVSLDLLDRMITSDNNVKPVGVDYSKVNPLKEHIVNASIGFLKESLF